MFVSVRSWPKTKKDPVHLFYCDGQVKMVGRNRGDDKNNGMHPNVCCVRRRLLLYNNQTCCINYFCSINIGFASLSNKSNYNCGEEERRKQREVSRRICCSLQVVREEQVTIVTRETKQHEHGNLEMGGRDNHLQELVSAII